MDKKNKKIAVAMSGGVDSSVAAILMKDGGFDCEGLTMLLAPKDPDRLHFGCMSDEEAVLAATVAKKLGIPHTTLRMDADFEEKVVRPFALSYLEGRTPNPCIECNRHIKFGALEEYALSNGFDGICTGHYAKIKREGGRSYLCRAADERKDQTYFLYSLTPEKLNRIYFPLGDMTKAEIRAIAEANGLPNAKKKDSQDICFVDGDYADFIRSYTRQKDKSGNFTDSQGNVLGKHDGILPFTVGQRKGLGIALGEPMYVISKDAASGTVVLGRDSELYVRSLDASALSLCVTPEEISGVSRIYAKIRYNQPPVAATLSLLGEGRIHVEFDEAVRAVCPGQSVVLYDGDVVLGGAVIN